MSLPPVQHGAMPDTPPIVLYPFSYFDPLRRRWIRARYVATLEDIRARHPEHRLEGEPEIRETGRNGFMLPTRRA
jgi:hypothetical protein